MTATNLETPDTTDCQQYSFANNDHVEVAKNRLAQQPKSERG